MDTQAARFQTVGHLREQTTWFLKKHISRKKEIGGIVYRL